MSLNVGKLTQDLNTAFKEKYWESCAIKSANAIDEFYKNGEAQVTINGTVTPPVGPPYSAVGTGTGNPNTTTVGLLIQKFNSAFTNKAWSAVGGIVAPEIENLVKSSTITLNVSNILIGTGTVTFISPGPSSLISQITQALTSKSWDQVASQIAQAVDTFIKSITVQGTANGSSPPASWTGTGTGSII